jgi:hypothetical protein
MTLLLFDIEKQKAPRWILVSDLLLSQQPAEKIVSRG